MQSFAFNLLTCGSGHSWNSQFGPVLPTEDPSGHIFASSVHALGLDTSGGDALDVETLGVDVLDVDTLDVETLGVDVLGADTLGVKVLC
jgi:hypothetical protein